MQEKRHIHQDTVMYATVQVVTCCHLTAQASPWVHVQFVVDEAALGQVFL